MAVYSKERMTRRVKWFFALPLTYVIYFALSLLIPGAGLFSVVLTSLVLILAFSLVSKFLLNFPLRSFIRQEGKVSWPLFLTGLLVMAVLCAGSTFVLMVLNPQMYEYSLRPETVVRDWLVSISVVLTAAFAEELLFRAYVAFFPSDSLEKDSSKFWKYCLASGILFALAHFQNPEVNGMSAIWFMSFYFTLGCFLMYFYMKSGGIEFSLGVHVGNNLIPALFFSYPSAVIKTNTVFMDKSPVNHVQLIQALVCLCVCTAVFNPVLKKNLSGRD